MHKIRILLVDDHTLLRTGVRMVLQAEPDLEVVGEASDGDSGVRLAAELHPDVVLMDLSMPGVGGLEATRRVTADGGETRVLVLTMHAGEEYLVPVLEAGGSGYVTKQSADTDLVHGNVLETARSPPVGARRQAFGERPQHRGGLGHRIALERFTARQHEHDDRASQVFAEEECRDDRDSGEKI